MRATLSKDGKSTAEVQVRITMATAAMARLSRLWTSSSISIHMQLCKSTWVECFHWYCLSVERYDAIGLKAILYFYIVRCDVPYSRKKTGEGILRYLM
ncbi:hypothetical protein DPMN_075450 [Dreissena polymorpha]|uniref:Uncharacterized protein n=1 Tax=Dreissena polymorpha TaxID=45954 RepID=A0A9D4BMN8_DREPO|nr:hypothetical protein DPMN_075450 [Dreissena polymorpha]